MNNDVSQNLIAGLQDMYKRSDAAQDIMDWCAGRTKDSSVTTVDRTEAATGVARHHVVWAFKELEELGAGRFIEGRHGHKSRFEWAYSLKAIGKAAQGKTGRLEAIEPAAEADVVADAEPGDLICHPFQLRPSARIEIYLPHDLTRAEAERVSKFVLTLPFE